MKQRKTKPGLESLYARLDQVNMNPADRLNARASLAQADALADSILGTMDLAKRAYGTLTLRPDSARG